MKLQPREIMFTLVSGNRKTGPIPVSGQLSSTCPTSCPFAPKRGKTTGIGCYAAYGNTRIHWKRLDGGDAGITWSEFIVKVKQLWRSQLWRFGQFGDLPGKGNKTDAKRLAELTAANRGKMGFAYSHRPVLDSQDKRNAPLNRAAIKAANQGGFTVNLSGNSPEHADQLLKLKIAPVVCVVTKDTPKVSFTPAGNKIVICPAQYDGSNITCARCGFCQRQDRSVVIGFRSHGNGARYVDAIAAA